mmetsp:Transcript_32272/g.126292  ORF Transcript_32272/g.126292 Transcript_32272/m.126292 type:complete len:154 (-) Transcript_32272:2120-2581(-)
MAPNCGPKFERVLSCMEEKHSSNSCRDVVHEFLMCQREFVRTVAREQQMKGPGTVTESGKPVAVADAMPSQNTQITPRREIQLLINKTLVSSMARAAKHQALAMKDTWNTLWEPETRQIFVKYCGRICKNLAVVVDKTFSEALGWSSGSKGRS